MRHYVASVLTSKFTAFMETEL